MKPSILLIKAVLVILIAVFWTGWTGTTSKEGLLWAADQKDERLYPGPGKVSPQGHHHWAPAPGWTLHDGCLPPPCGQWTFGHPAWPGYNRPHYLPFLPYPIYPPSYEPKKPWYEDEALIPAGSLHLLVAPVEAEAYLDGYPLERQPDLSYEVNLLEGEHQIEVSAGGYVPFQSMVDIQGGQRLRLTIRLERAGEQ